MEGESGGVEGKDVDCGEKGRKERKEGRLKWMGSLCLANDTEKLFIYEYNETLMFHVTSWRFSFPSSNKDEENK